MMAIDEKVQLLKLHPCVEGLDDNAILEIAEAAVKYGVTAGRISQLRRLLEQSWAAFQRERASAAAH